MAVNIFQKYQSIGTKLSKDGQSRLGQTPHPPQSPNDFIDCAYSDDEQITLRFQSLDAIAIDKKGVTRCTKTRIVAAQKSQS